MARAVARAPVAVACRASSARRSVATSRRVPRCAAASDARSITRRVALVAPVLLRLVADAADARAGTAPRVLVVGSTGATGKLVVEELAKSGKASAVVAGVRSAEKAKKLGLDAVADVASGVDVTRDVGELTRQFEGFDVVVVCTGFVPGNPLKMNAAAHEVDNLGVRHVADAARDAGVKKVVLISSILTNGPAMGAADTAGYRITNAFGRVLEEKLEGENYLRASGVPWVIIRPAGLKNDEPKQPLVLTGEDVMTSGEISRALVAKVMSAAAFDDRTNGKVYEIAESGSFVGGDHAGGAKFALDTDPASWFA